MRFIKAFTTFFMPLQDTLFQVLFVLSQSLSCPCTEKIMQIFYVKPKMEKVIPTYTFYAMKWLL